MQKAVVREMLLLCCLVVLLPWAGVVYHSSNEIHRDDGPATVMLLSVTTIGTFLIFILYGLGTIVLSKFRVNRTLCCVANAILLLVFALCVALSLLWAKVSLDGEWLFVAAAAGYATLSAKVAINVLRALKSRRATRKRH